MTWYLKKQGTVRVIVAGRPVSPACVAYREEVYGDVEYDPRGREDGTGGCSQGMLRSIRVQNN